MKFLNKKTIGIFLALILIFIIKINFFNKNQENTHLGQMTHGDLIQRVTLAGSITPFKKTIIAAPYNGYIKKIFVKIGDKVKIGDPLVSVAQSLQSKEENFPMRSPLNGTVVQIQKSEGEYAKEGDIQDGFIMRIDDTSSLGVFSMVPEIDRVKIKAKQEVVIKASAMPDKIYKGIITDLSLSAREKDQWSRSQVVEFPVRISVLDADENLKPGMSVLLDIITDKKQNVNMLKHEFVRRSGSRYYVVLENNQERDIVVGKQNEEGFEVISGLKPDEKVKQVDYSELSGAD